MPASGSLHNTLPLGSSLLPEFNDDSGVCRFPPGTEAPYEATASQRAIHRSMLDLHSTVVQDAQAVEGTKAPLEKASEHIEGGPQQAECAHPKNG